MDRRNFMRSVTGTVGAISLASVPVAVSATYASELHATAMSPSSAIEGSSAMTIRQVLDLIIANAPGAPFADTVDTIKAGDPAQQVKGIVTTMFATVEVIRKAIAAGANLIIAHEPTFYSHLDKTDTLVNDDVYKYKLDLLDKHNIVVWRCHDYIHEFNPDGVYEGVLDKLGWKSYADKDSLARLVIPPATLKSVIAHTKDRLGIPMVRYMGDPSSTIRTITLMVGAPGGPRQIAAINETKPDLVIIGELVEWETMEYMRDLRAAGMKTSMIILGHIASEEQGMNWLAGWLKPQIGQVPVKFIASGQPVKWA